ncbi:N-acetyltransferase family protein [Halomonas sp. A29]|uniref:GNAT family N-acetyltransferase n=1 Tax=Halomonas sp. A29 TaxID=3102786 RepID=UPI00398B5528
MVLSFKPLTTATWHDFEALLGAYEGCKGCWCMHWRLSFPDWKKQQGEGNRRAMKACVDAGDVPGILAYAEGRPVAWCGCGPREWYPRLNKSQVAKPVDDQEVLSVNCFFVDRRARGNNIQLELLREVLRFAKQQGYKVVEGYPVEPGERRLDSSTSLVGFAKAFEEAGFHEVARRKKDRPIMRKEIQTG